MVLPGMLWEQGVNTSVADQHRRMLLLLEMGEQMLRGLQSFLWLLPEITAKVVA